MSLTIDIVDIDPKTVNKAAVYSEVLANIAAHLDAGNLKDSLHLLNYTTSFGVKVRITLEK